MKTIFFGDPWSALLSFSAEMTDEPNLPFFGSIFQLIIILFNFSFAFLLLFTFSVIRQLNAIDGILYHHLVTPITTNRTDGELLTTKLENEV